MGCWIEQRPRSRGIGWNWSLGRGRMATAPLPSVSRARWNSVVPGVAPPCPKRGGSSMFSVGFVALVVRENVSGVLVRTCGMFEVSTGDRLVPTLPC